MVKCVDMYYKFFVFLYVFLVDLHVMLGFLNSPIICISIVKKNSSF